MKTLNLEEAAQFLKLHPEELRRCTKAGIIPGAKLGKCWVFIEDDLAAHMRSLYATPRQALQVGHEEKQLCHSVNVVRRGGLVFTAPSGERIRCSAATEDKTQAQEFHDKLKAESWRVVKLGDKPKRTWDEAAYKWLDGNTA